MLIADKWNDYKILDCGNGEKLEVIAGYKVVRPDGQVIWNKKDKKLWTDKVHAIYHRSSEGGGYWQYINKPKEDIVLNYNKIKFNIELTGFKHIGLFPEQAVNWDLIIDLISKAKAENRSVKVLNLFAYTGGATVASAFAGAEETVHVDASKRIVSQAKENIELNNLADKKVRFIVEDVMKFVMREIRRGRKYDIIIMDPPVYGRGPDGELWQIESSLVELVSKCIELLSGSPLLFLINCYTANISHISISNMLSSMLLHKYNNMTVQSDEIALPIENSSLILPCGITARFFQNK